MAIKCVLINFHVWRIFLAISALSNWIYLTPRDLGRQRKDFLNQREKWICNLFELHSGSFFNKFFYWPRVIFFIIFMADSGQVWPNWKLAKVIADFISNLSVSTALTLNKTPKLTFLPAPQIDLKYDLNYLISMLNW